MKQQKRGASILGLLPNQTRKRFWITLDSSHWRIRESLHSLLFIALHLVRLGLLHHPQYRTDGCLLRQI